MKRIVLAFGLLLPAATAVVLFQWLRGPSVRPNVLLITVDTLRADHLGVYGYDRRTSPNLDGLAREGVVFENAFTHASLSGPSHATIMTSLYPPTHGVTMNGVKVSKDHLTLAEVLRASGYETGMFVSHGAVSGWFGFAQGFDWSRRYHVDSHRHHHAGEPEPSAALAEVFDAALEWISEPRDRPFFVWLHAQHPHKSYEPPEPFDRKFREPPQSSHDLRCSHTLGAHDAEKITLNADELDYVIALYDGEIAYVDDQLGRILTRLREPGLERETVVLLTADHGEMLFDDAERREQGHAAFALDPVLRVPLIVRDVGRRGAGRRVVSHVGLIDVAPTILDLVGVEEPDVFAGTSLVPLWKREVEIRPRHYAFTSSGKLSDLRHRLTVRTSRMKLICRMKRADPDCRLFDLELDPGEHGDRSDDPNYAEEQERLQTALFEWFRSNVELRRLRELKPFDERTRELLRRAGYLQEDEE